MEEMHNKDERERILARMSAVSHVFYMQARAINCHPFIELTGLMNEYINCCRLAHERGIDFTQCSTHTGVPLPMADHHVKYVNEKLECIFTGRSFCDVGKR